MDRISIVDHIRRDDKLLSIPQVLSEVLQEVKNENFSAESLSKVILKDPNLTSRILKLVNSPFYHRMAEITTVNQAISLLGVTTVKCMALSTSILNPQKVAAQSGVDPRSFFAYELAIAAAAEQTAKAVNYKAHEEAFIAGLLQDIGILYFLHHYPEQYRQVMDRSDRNETLLEAEENVFGITHPEVGAYLAEKWTLPEHIVAAIRDHHLERSESKDKMADIVGLAVLLTSDNFSGFQLKIERRLELIKERADRMGLGQATLDEISSSLLSATISTAEFLGIDIGDIEEMLAKANQEIWKSYLTIANLFKERQELSRKLLLEEHAKGAEESKNVAMATLSHYLNNAVMAIYGRSQLLRMQSEKGSPEKLLEKLSANLDIVDRSVRKVVAVLEEMKQIVPLDKRKFHRMSEAMNIDDRIDRRMESMEKTNDISTVMSASEFESQYGS